MSKILSRLPTYRYCDLAPPMRPHRPRYGAHPPLLGLVVDYEDLLGLVWHLADALEQIFALLAVLRRLSVGGALFLGRKGSKIKLWHGFDGVLELLLYFYIAFL